MNNKVLARIVAAALAVMMLGTLAFADNTAEYEDGTITSTTDAAYGAQTIFTLLAYKADSETDTEFVDADIIAIEQSINIADIKDIEIDPAKVDTRYIKVLYGGKEGVTKSATIDLLTSEDLTAITISALTEGQGHGDYVFDIEDENGELVPTTFQNVVKVVCSFAPKAGKTITKIGVKFQGYTAGTENKMGYKFEKDVNIAGSGVGIDYTAYLFGVPEADVTNAAYPMVAVPFIEYY